MKKLLTILFTLFCFLTSYSQPNSEKISVKTISTIQFTYQDINELLQPKQINNAIELKVKVKENTLNVFAQVMSTNPDYYQFFNNKLALRLQNHNSYNASTTNEVLLSNSPSLLFTQPSVPHTEHFDFYYDLILYPSTTFANAGMYDFSITFTMTNP